MASGGTGSGPARPKNHWNDAPAWSMGARSEWKIVTPEAQSHPGPGAYNLAPGPQARRPQQKKGFARDQKNTFAGFSPNLKDVSQTPGPGAYVLPGDFDKARSRAVVQSHRSAPPQHRSRVPTALAPCAPGSAPSKAKQPVAVAQAMMPTGTPSAAGVTRDSQYGEVVSRMAWHFDSPPTRKQHTARYAMPTAASTARCKAGPKAQP